MPDPRQTTVRILYINPAYTGGGAERSARELMAGVVAAGAEAAMLVAVPRRGDPPAVRGARVPGERFLRPLERAWGAPLDWTHVGSKLALGRVTPDTYDVVHLHNLHGAWLSFKAVAALARRMPCVWTLHDEWGPTGGLTYDLSRAGGKYVDAVRGQPGWESMFPDAPAARRIRRLLDRQTPRPAALISPSQYLMDLARRSGRFPDARLIHLPYGMTLQNSPAAAVPQAEARRRFGLYPDGPVVLLMAAHLKAFYKGTAAAVDALRGLPADAFTLLAVGAGADALAGQVPQRVVGTGYLSDDTAVAAAFRAADLTLVPSVADNFPYVGLESMACERPLVTFKVGGLSEMVGNDERGASVAPFDTAELGRRMMALLADPPARARLGRAARQWVGERCDMGRWVSAHLGVYRQACADFEVRRHPAGATGARDAGAVRPTEAMR
jgi:glycosyltransferase involved in cell wall biosynthesis